MNENDLSKDAREDLVIVYVNDFTSDSFKDFQESFFKAEHSGQTVVPVMIDSDGGDVTSLFAMIDVIKSSKLSVCTIGVGKALSCGADLLAAGTKGYRYASPLCTIMVHEGSSCVVGKPADIKADVKEDERLYQKSFDMLDAHCGKMSGYWASILKEALNVDVYMTPEQAKAHGLIDFVRLPRFEPEVIMKTRIV